jgi:hypothetical protein
MIKNPNEAWYHLTGPEFLAQLGTERPALFTDWKSLNKAQGLRAIESNLLPFEASPIHPQETHVLAWPNGTLMVSRRVWLLLGGT